VSKGFEKKTGIKVSTVRLGGGEAMKRIQAEKDRPLCDIFRSGDVPVLDAAKEYFMPYRSPQAKGLPAGYIDKTERWTSTNTRIMIIMVNKSLVKHAEIPWAWKGLLDPRSKGKVVMANPEKSGSAYAQVYGIWKLYDWDGIRKLIANAKVLGSSSLIYKGVAAGEYPVGITMEYATHRYIAGGDKNVAIVYPADGAFLAPEAAAIVKSAPHPRSSRRHDPAGPPCGRAAGGGTGQGFETKEGKREGLLHLENAVLAAVLVPATGRAAGVVGPYAVDDEAVLVPAGREIEGCLPVAGRPSLEGSGGRVPRVEGPGHRHLSGVGGVDGEGDPLPDRPGARRAAFVSTGACHR